MPALKSTDFMEPKLAARFSPDRLYRYELWRQWAYGDFCMFIGLNPSTADETKDDPTIRRCISFARDWGFASLCMVNLFAYRATDPAEMKRASDDPVGEDNDRTLKELASKAGCIIAAWGIHGSFQERDKEVISLLPRMSCLGTTKEGYPKHPLYLKKDTKPRIFN